MEPIPKVCWRCGRWGNRQFIESGRSDSVGRWECTNDRACIRRARTAKQECDFPNSESWKSMALALGRRMQYHVECSEHPSLVPGCPSCKDRDVYELFVRFASAAGVDIDKETIAGTAVDLYDVPMTVAAVR